MSATPLNPVAQAIFAKWRNGFPILVICAAALLFMNHSAANAQNHTDNQTENPAAGQFLADNARQDGVETTSSGLQFQTITAGDGPSPMPDDTALVTYKGMFTDGTIFDESSETALPINQLVSGFSEAMQKMQKGGTYKIWIPSDIGYGPDDQTDPQTGKVLIPGGSVLVFEVSLIDFKSRAEIEELRAQNAPPPRRSFEEIESILGFETIKVGKGPSPAENDTVLLSYRGMFADGVVFDQNAYTVFGVDRVIPGFSVALQKMQIGGEYRIEIPSEAGYGPEDRINPRTGEVSIPGGSTLIFEVSLIHFKPKAEIDEFNNPANRAIE